VFVYLIHALVVDRNQSALVSCSYLAKVGRKFVVSLSGEQTYPQSLVYSMEPAIHNYTEIPHKTN